jgi:hypothetical protein
MEYVYMPLHSTPLHSIPFHHFPPNQTYPIVNIEDCW